MNQAIPKKRKHYWQFVHVLEKRAIWEASQHRHGGRLALIRVGTGELLERRLLSGSIWTVAGRFGGAMVGIVNLLTFVISPEEVGAYNLALSIISFGALVGALGLPNTVVRLVAENVVLNRCWRARRVIYTVLGLGVVGALFSSPVQNRALWGCDRPPEMSSLLPGTIGGAVTWAHYDNGRWRAELRARSC
jgi:hypothetical protein